MSEKAVNEANGYRKGMTRRQKILEVARDLLIENGYHNFSIRKVADSAGIRVGNLQYYFPTKDDLVQAMLDWVLQDYLDEFVEIRHHGTPQEQFLGIIKNVIFDLSSLRTTVFFPELWSLSNHDKQVTKLMDGMYERYRQVLAEVIREMNPALSERQARRLALFISASIEGHTVFIGCHKPWEAEADHILQMAGQSFVWLIMNGDISDD